MIGTSVDTRAFSEIATDERFRAEPPRNSSLLINDTIDITRSGAVTDVRLADIEPFIETRPVEHTLADMTERCRLAAAKYPSSARSHMNLGLALLRGGHASEGIAELQLAVFLDATDYVAAGSLAAAHFNSGNLDLAEKLYAEMTKTFSNSVAGFMGLASISLRRNLYQEAIPFLEQALKVAPNLENASFLLSVVYFKINKPERAISILRRALSDNPRSPELNQGLAIAFLLSGDAHRAERSFQAAIALSPGLSSARRGLALIWLQQGRADEVTELLSKHLEACSDDIKSREILAQALISKGNYRQARSQLMEIRSRLTALPLQDRDEIAKIQNNIGYCFAQDGNYRDAVIAIRESIESAVHPRHEAAENLARVFLLQGDFDRALDSIEKSLLNGVKSSGLLLLKGACLINRGRFEEAIGLMLRLIAQEDAPKEAYAELGWLLCEWREDFPAAIAVLKTGLDKWSDSALIVNNLAYAHLMNGDIGAAHALLEMTHHDSKAAVFLTATRGLLALFEGDIEKGKTLYREAEDLAAQLGDRNTMLAVRQKSCLEIARALMKKGDLRLANRFVEQGKAVITSDRRFPFQRQLAELAGDLARALPSGTTKSN